MDNKSVVSSPKSSPKSKGKGSIPGKMRVHPHTAKALKAVAINSGFKKKSVGGTNNGLSGSDSRY